MSQMRSASLIGMRFGRWTVIGEGVVVPKQHTRKWLCRCDCGNEKLVATGSLKNGDSKSCGCLQAEYAREHGRKMLTKHGYYGTSLYHRWRGIKDRCMNPNTPMYKHYGGRGIKMCDEWLNDPVAFCEWALANGYRDDLTIDRIDVNGNYEPSNCRWIPNEKQQTNKRNCVYITFNGKTQCVSEWARELNIPKHQIFSRRSKGITDPYELLYGRKETANVNTIVF